MPSDSTALLSRPETPPAPASRQPACAGTLLLVDDEPVIRLLINEAMSEIGYRVIEAGHAAEGVGLLESCGPIDLLISDVTLPGPMNGRQLADAARTMQPGLPVLFITGSADRGDEAIRSGGAATRMLLKPFRLETLVETTVAMLSQP